MSACVPGKLCLQNRCSQIWPTGRSLPVPALGNNRPQTSIECRGEWQTSALPSFSRTHTLLPLFAGCFWVLLWPPIFWVSLLLWANIEKRQIPSALWAFSSMEQDGYKHAPVRCPPFSLPRRCLEPDLSFISLLFLRVCHFHFISPPKRMEVSLGSSIVVPTMTGWARVQECSASGPRKPQRWGQGSDHLGSAYWGVSFNANVNRYLKVALKKGKLGAI